MVRWPDIWIRSSFICFLMVPDCQIWIRICSKTNRLQDSFQHNQAFGVWITVQLPACWLNFSTAFHRPWCCGLLNSPFFDTYSAVHFWDLEQIGPGASSNHNSWQWVGITGIHLHIHTSPFILEYTCTSTITWMTVQLSVNTYTYSTCTCTQVMANLISLKECPLTWKSNVPLTVFMQRLNVQSNAAFPWQFPQK